MQCLLLPMMCIVIFLDGVNEFEEKTYMLVIVFVHECAL